MSAEQKKKNIARQLRGIIVEMRVVAPLDFIGVCDGTEIRDKGVRFTYHSALCRDEAAFDDSLLSGLYE